MTREVKSKSQYNVAERMFFFVCFFFFALYFGWPNQPSSVILGICIVKAFFFPVDEFGRSPENTYHKFCIKL